MAEGTRMKDLQEAQKRIDHILQTEALKREATEMKLQEQISGINSEMHEQLTGLNGKYEHLTNTLAAIQLQLLNMGKSRAQTEEESILGGPYQSGGSEGIQSRNQYSPKGRMITDQQGIHILNPLPKIDFPRFDGSNPRSWILKCNGYFKLIPNIPDTQKVTLASMHFEGKTAQWFQNFCTKQTELSWQQFIEIISARFEELKETKIIAEFNKLKHTEEELAYIHSTPDTVVDQETSVEPMDEIQMTLNAIAGEDGITTMRLYGKCGEHRLHILIDSGSTLSFIQEATAKKLGCHLQAAKPLLVKVANGQRLVSTQRAEGFTWDMQGNMFTYPLRLLKNEGCDLILGGDWLKACTPIELDYDKMTFTVTSKGKRVRIQALTSAAECKLISGDTLYKMLHMDYKDQIEELKGNMPCGGILTIDREMRDYLNRTLCEIPWASSLLQEEGYVQVLHKNADKIASTHNKFSNRQFQSGEQSPSFSKGATKKMPIHQKKDRKKRRDDSPPYPFSRRVLSPPSGEVQHTEEVRLM
ncbi:hypothetical protein DH2020_000299 [Rehmannia glutinosa]|uniref:Ty3 transposon capsid-like protein domain-containing protein n=1 Tax=Rehmannia glutinosa TaxID=99300 RepID=A0ABR0XW40_REHGL